jgi:hypothetical protein
MSGSGLARASEYTLENYGERLLNTFRGAVPARFGNVLHTHEAFS